MKTFVRFLIILIVLVVIAVFAVLYTIYNSGSTEQNVLEEQSFDEEIAEMEIRLENARVDFVPSNDDTTRVVLTGTNDDFTLRTELSGGRLQIEIEDRSPFFSFGFRRSYSLKVQVPQTGLELLMADSDNGAITARNINAVEVSIEADNGRIELVSVESEKVTLETDNGRILSRDMEADITARTANGRITFTDVSGELHARANNGRINLTTGTLDFPVDFETDNGRIEIQTENEPSNTRIEAHTDNGRIELYGQNSAQLTFGSGDVLVKLASDNGRIIVE